MTEPSPSKSSPHRIPVQTIGRLSLYRRLLLDLSAGGMRQIYSHQLASAAVATPAQVRRDLMMIGFTGSPRKGYAVEDLIAAVNAVLAKSVETSVALVGVGNLGRAILAYYTNRQPWVRFTAAFDCDPDKANRIIHGCRVYPFDQVEDVLWPRRHQGRRHRGTGRRGPARRRPPGAGRRPQFPELAPGPASPPDGRVRRRHGHVDGA